MRIIHFLVLFLIFATPILKAQTPAAVLVDTIPAGMDIVPDTSVASFNVTIIRSGIALE